MQSAKYLFIFAILILLSSSVAAFGSNKVIPTTTLAAETGNNTSTSSSFQGQKNGNPAPGNVSKVDTRALLYPGSTTAIYAHYMPWFGTASHVNVGYSTSDPTQATRQVEDMISRGIQGIIVDWYGRNFAHEEQSTQAIFDEVQKHPDFKFAIMEDGGALKGADKTSELIADLIYAAQKYQQSPNYLRSDNRPVVFFFGAESLGIDWKAVRAQVPGHPLFVFENSSGLKLDFSDGAFGWVNGFSSDLLTNWGQSYLTNYYDTAEKSNRYAVGSVWKGFNDSLAVWSQKRILGQNCGQTWLNTFAEIGKHYSSGNQLDSLQLVTWNDYEEGTSLETGIDNCASVKASVSGNRLSWSITGNENTIHHYTVFISTDGSELMPVADVPAGTNTLDLGGYDFQNGGYNLYVKAVGQPSIRNQMSGVIGWSNSSSIDAPPTAVAPADFQVVNTATIVRLPRGGSFSSNIVLTPKGDFDTPVTLRCANVPANLSCAFDQKVVTLRTRSVTTRLVLTARQESADLRGPHAPLTWAMWLPGLGMVFVGGRKRSRKMVATLMGAALLALLLMTTGCVSLVSDTGKTTLESKSETYTVNIVAQAGSIERTTSATVTVQ